MLSLENDAEISHYSEIERTLKKLFMHNHLHSYWMLFFDPETISSIRKIMHALSIAVLIV